MFYPPKLGNAMAARVPVALGTPLGWQGADGTPLGWQGADGTPLYVGTRVQTQWTREEGGDGRWYPGRVVAMLASGEVTIKYDDGDDWTGSGLDVHLLDGAHPLKTTVGVADHGAAVTGRWFRCLQCYCIMLAALPFLLSALEGDMRTGETGLWYTLDSCLSETTPAFVYTLRAADAAGVHGGGFQPRLTLVLALALALARSSLRRSGSCP